VTVSKLKAAGIEGGTPCALISRASARAQQITTTTIEKLTEAGAHAKPAILIVGEVARLSRGDEHRLNQTFLNAFRSEPDFAAQIAANPAGVRPASGASTHE
jgi:siroheme synthase